MFFGSLTILLTRRSKFLIGVPRREFLGSGRSVNGSASSWLLVETEYGRALR